MYAATLKLHKTTLILIKSNLDVCTLKLILDKNYFNYNFFVMVRDAAVFVIFWL